MVDGGIGGVWLGLSNSGVRLGSGCLGDMSAAAASGFGGCGLVAKRHTCIGDCHQAWTRRVQGQFKQVQLPFNEFQ